MDLIAKKYAKAIALRTDMSDFYDKLQVINTAFSLEKFKNIIVSSQVKKEKKLELICSFFDQLSPSFKNFLALLVDNSRLDCIPQITKELEKQKAIQENTFFGVVYTQEKLDESKLSDLEQKLGSKFNVKIKLENKLVADDGVKITLEELGYEISFSMQSLQSKMCEFILKTI